MSGETWPATGGASPSAGEAPPGPTWAHGRRRDGITQRQREVAMCRWMAYSGEPILAEELLFRPTHSIIDQSLHAKLQGYTTNGDGFGIGWYGDSDNAGRVQEHPPRLERPRSARDRRTDPHPAAVRTHPRLERDPGAAQQLPPVPVRPVVVDAQRVARRLPGDEARPDDGGGPVAVRGHRGIDRHRDPVLPGPHLRPGRTTRPTRSPARSASSKKSATATESSTRST